MDLKDCSDGSGKIIGFRLRSVVDVHRVPSPWYIEYRRVVKVFGKLLGIHGRGRDQKLQLWPKSCNVFDESKENVRVQGPFVGFINHQSRVRSQIWLGQEFS